MFVIKGYRQSWRYTQGIEWFISRHLVFRNPIKRFAKGFLDRNIPQNWTNENFTRVAIHVRRTDVVSQPPENGYLTPGVSYYKRAMAYFMREYGRTQFVVLSDDLKWTRENIKQPMDKGPMSVSVTCVTHVHARYVNGRDDFDGHDLAIMSMCGHTIISVGSYGWWGAFLANGTTIYYAEWPRNGSNLQQNSVRSRRLFSSDMDTFEINTIISGKRLVKRRLKFLDLSVPLSLSPPCYETGFIFICESLCKQHLQSYILTQRFCPQIRASDGWMSEADVVQSVSDCISLIVQ